MSLGLEGALGANEFQKALRQQILDHLAQQQQAFQNSMATRGADRADRALSQQDTLTRLKIQEMADSKTAAENDKAFTQAEKANEAVPAGTVFPSIDGRPSASPIVGRLSMIGALQPTAGSLGSTTDTPANLKTGTPPSGRLIAMPAGQVKLPSANQANVLADNARADAKDAEAARRAAQNVPLVPVGKEGILTPHDEAIGQPTYRPPREPKDTSASDANRLDKSYQFNSSQLEKVRTPIASKADRLAGLNEQLTQGTPAADALVAPEILSIAAGGQGSGLRMNEAEISRIVGGRSAWENLKASLQHLSLDPKAANSITPDQRAQMRQILTAAQTRVQSKVSAINKAEQALVDAEDVRGHRQVLTNLQGTLDAIDNGGGTSSPAPAAASAPKQETWVRNAQGKLVKSGQ